MFYKLLQGNIQFVVLPISQHEKPGPLKHATRRAFSLPFPHVNKLLVFLDPLTYLYLILFFEVSLWKTMGIHHSSQAPPDELASDSLFDSAMIGRKLFSAIFF